MAMKRKGIPGGLKHPSRLTEFQAGVTYFTRPFYPLAAYSVTLYKFGPCGKTIRLRGNRTEAAKDYTVVINMYIDQNNQRLPSDCSAKLVLIKEGDNPTKREIPNTSTPADGVDSYDITVPAGWSLFAECEGTGDKTCRIQYTIA